MTSKVAARNYDRIGLWMTLAVVVLTLSVFLWTRSLYQGGDTSLATHVDEQGMLHVLGVTLGRTTLEQAEDILQSKSDVALFIYPEGHLKAGLKLEAFFPAIADHTKVVLLLDMPNERLHDLESRATLPHLYPNKVARMNLAATDRTSINTVTVQELTLIPNLTVSAEMLKARFGEPEQIISMDGYEQYIYDHMGLRVMLYKEAPPSLHFFNPLPDKGAKTT